MEKKTNHRTLMTTSFQPNTAEGLQRAAVSAAPVTDTAPPVVHDVLRSTGQPLDAVTREYMEPRFGHDFSHVRVYTDDRAVLSARSVNALAYTAGDHIAFNTDQYRPDTSDGRLLIAHELAHVVQQGGGAHFPETVASADDAHESQAQRVASEITSGQVSKLHDAPGSPGIQRQVQFRDVGRGEFSGFARLGELIDRMNAMPGSLTYSLNGGSLAYERKEGEELSAFDAQMMEFVDLPAVIPLRLTNRQGLIDSGNTGTFDFQVQEDAWASGYVDIDDLLASTDLGLQSVLVHFLRERAATQNYARRIGSPSLDPNLPGPQAEFQRVHALGEAAETRLLQDFFGDPTIRQVRGAESGNIFRVYRNDRGDRFRTRVRSNRGIDAVSVEVRIPDGRVLAPEEYLDLLRQERTRAQVERERLGGAAEHMADGRPVPAP